MKKKTKRTLSDETVRKLISDPHGWLLWESQIKTAARERGYSRPLCLVYVSEAVEFLRGVL
jgi:hypothetical protein